MADINWLQKIEALKPGDACDFKWPARRTWHKGEVVHNGMAYYWTVKITESYVDEVNGEVYKVGDEARGLYIEQIRLPNQIEAWPRPGENATTGK